MLLSHSSIKDECICVLDPPAVTDPDTVDPEKHLCGVYIQEFLGEYLRCVCTEKCTSPAYCERGFKTPVCVGSGRVNNECLSDRRTIRTE